MDLWKKKRRKNKVKNYGDTNSEKLLNEWVLVYQAEGMDT